MLQIGEIAAALGEDRAASEAAVLAERISEGRFYVACVGQFKRGKSTLLSALVGDSILPTGVTPVTSVPTVIRYGKSKTARVRIEGEWRAIAPYELAEYVSEEQNPENRKSVEGVEVFLHSELLSGGMCLVDTPGIGSVFLGNTEATRAFIPHIDAVIIVVGADPPITADELSLIDALGSQVRDLLVVLNKADRVTEKERIDAAEFTKRMIESRLARPVDRIYEVSALERLERSGAHRDWSEFVGSLERLSSQSGDMLAKSAQERGTRRLSEALFRVIEEQRQALIQPLEVSETRIAFLRETVSQAERSLLDLGHLFSAEQNRLARKFEENREKFLGDVKRHAHAELEREFSALRHGYGPSFRISAMTAAQAVARRNVLPWLEEQQRHAEGAYRRATARFVELANDFLEKLAESGTAEMAGLPERIEDVRGFETKTSFVFHEFVTVARSASPVLYLGDVVIGLVRFYKPIVENAHEFLDKLLVTNSSRVQSDVDERVAEGRRRLESRIRKTLQDVSGVAERALTNARNILATGSSAVEAELERLNELRLQLEAVMQSSNFRN
ncbi:MAG: dynamin family protein [Terriglobia bacterium]|nr:dynamin family protein [Terriglobia bacterium]